MKKYILLLVILIKASLVAAQVSEVITDIYGNCKIVVRIQEQGYVTISPYGKVLEVDLYGDRQYYSDFHAYEAGKIKNMGAAMFTYYSDFHNYEAGKIKTIANITFKYYSDFLYYEAGKIKSIAGMEFTYYSDFHPYEAGKIKSIGKTTFTYYSDFNSYQAGKIKSIADNNYTYSADNLSKNRADKLPNSGKLNFEKNGIKFKIVIFHKYRHHFSPSLQHD